MLRKTFALILALLMTLSVTAAGYDSEENSSPALYMQTCECPDDILNYISENASKFILGIDENHELSYNDVYVGQPFTYGDDISNLYLFPIFEGNDVVYTLRVTYSPDGSIQGTISSFLADELNSYIGYTSVDSPLRFDVSGHSLYAVTGNEAELVLNFPIDETIPVSLSNLSDNNLEIVNAAEPLSVEFSWITTRDPSHYIYLSRTESQPSNNNWCVAYAMAAILRTQIGGGYTAQQIMRYYYGSGVSSSQSLSMSLGSSYAREVGGLTYTTYTSSGLSNSELMAQIDDDYPVCLRMINQSQGGGHAVVLRGYAMSTWVWSIWNPVNDSGYESFPIDGEYVSTTGNVFVYNQGQTIYNCYY